MMVSSRSGLVGEQRDLRAGQFLDPTHIFDGVGGKIGPAPRAMGGFAPAL